MTTQRAVLVDVTEVLLRRLDQPQGDRMHDLEAALKITLALLEDLGWGFAVPDSLNRPRRA